MHSDVKSVTAKITYKFYFLYICIFYVSRYTFILFAMDIYLNLKNFILLVVIELIIHLNNSFINPIDPFIRTEWMFF